MPGLGGGEGGGGGGGGLSADSSRAPGTFNSAVRHTAAYERVQCMIN